jgi:hypothetical protein
MGSMEPIVRLNPLCLLVLACATTASSVQALDIAIAQRIRNASGTEDKLIIADRDGSAVLSPFVGTQATVLLAPTGSCGAAILGMTEAGLEAQLDDGARACLGNAPAGSSPILFVPPLLVDGELQIHANTFLIPMNLTLAESPKNTDFENYRLGFRIIYLPPDIQMPQLLDPTAWCVTQGGENCLAQLTALRTSLSQSTSPGPDTECKSPELSFSVAQVQRQTLSGVDSLTLTFCRATYQPSEAPVSVQWIRFEPAGSVTTTLAVANLRRLSFLAGAQNAKGEAIAFTATAPSTPAQNTFYAELFFQNRRQVKVPQLKAADFSAVTIVPPSLQSTTVYGFKLNLTPDNIPDLKPILGKRKFSIHVAPVISALFNNEDDEDDPNHISIGGVIDIRRWFAEKSCHLVWTDGNGATGPDCGSAPPIRRVSFQVGPHLEMTKDATNKNFIADPKLSFFFRPLKTASGLAVSFVPSFGLEAGSVLASAVDATGRKEIGSIARFLGEGLLAIGFVPKSKSALADFMSRLDLACEFQLRQLVKDEAVKVSPGTTVFPPGQLIVGSNAAVLFPGSTKALPGAIETRSGTRRFLNLQATWDLKNGVILVASYRRGQLPPLYAAVEQFTFGVGFRINSKSKPSLK